MLRRLLYLRTWRHRATASTASRSRESPRGRIASRYSATGRLHPFRVKKDDNQLTMDPVVEDEEAEEEERHWVTGIGWKPARAGWTPGRAERMAPPSSPTSAKNCADYVPSHHLADECPRVAAPHHAPAAAAHGKACTGEDDGRRRSPAAGDNKRFCPAGCVRPRPRSAAAAGNLLVVVIPDDDGRRRLDLY